ncbi:hypothetical protein [Metamycoplasma neophronis]|uniref:Uncharacterized protein n=1 Tax=Metamycoplasma neophronis TaxID=872983 RepID=A0ABY2YZR4_9BACT|nr:hypothetical protein [Metamycoplasma neophronis]TPR53534.1 hypothetical protein FJR74_02445 [Metamycoplasma neophronis]
MINFANNTTAAQPAKGNQFLIYTLLGIVFFIIALYMATRFIINFKRSIKKTKDLLGEDLRIKYVQGFNIKSNATINYIIINIIFLAVAIIGAVLIPKVLKNPDIKVHYEAFFVALLVIALLSIIVINATVLAIYLVSFNYAQYKHNKKDISLELTSLKNAKKHLTYEYPEEIKLDIKKMEEGNPLAPRVLAHFVSFYNKMHKKDIMRQYKEFLNQKFKIEYFAESLGFIEEQQAKEALILGIDKDLTNSKALTKIEKEIQWMDKMDKKVKIIKETENISTMDKKEFNKKYEEYLYTVRSQDPMYQQTQKNGWLTYRDGDIEDLFYNPTSTVIYSIDNGQTVMEKELPEFLKEYKKMLEAKFFANK